MLVVMIWRNHKFTYEALSFDHAVEICKQKYAQLGLIGRAYIEFCTGEKTWINS